MAATVKKGLEHVQELYKDRSKRVKELKAEGKKIVGYLCIYPVTEIMTALDLIPFRVLGDMREPITKSDAYLPPVVCPFLRSCLDIGLKGKYDFLDAMVTSHICDVGSSLSGIWRYTVKTPFHYNIDTPHTVHDTSLEQTKAVFRAFRTAMETFAGKIITPEMMEKAIKKHNKQRALVRELYDLRKQNPPLITGAETLKVIKAIQSLPVEEGSELIREVIEDVKTRKNRPEAKNARLLVWGSILDDTAMIEMIESLDAWVVMDDTCVGSRAFFDDVKLTKDPVDGLAQHYLLDIKCPRTFRARDFYDVKKSYIEDLKSRFSYLFVYIRDWQANGVILQSVRYCDTHGYEVPQVRDYLKEVGVPSIYLEHDYTEGALAPMKTRVQGFLEIIE
jgi:benzoyl-CoA reductase subunit C